MSIFVQSSDFSVGQFKLSRGVYTDADLQNIIDENEPRILKELLGCSLYDLFIADYDVNTKTFSEARFTKIYEPFCEEESNCWQYLSEGMKIMLMAFIMVEYIDYQDQNNRITGQVNEETENSKRVDGTATAWYNIYNRAIKTYHAIQWYITCEKPEDYPEENTQKKDYASWL